MSLDDKLREIVLSPYKNNGMVNTHAESVSPIPDQIAQIKQVFADEGWLNPEQVAKTQELVNQMANLAQDMAMRPVIVRAEDLQA